MTVRQTIEQKIINGETITYEEFADFMEGTWDYELGDVTDFLRHGWLIRELLLEINGKHYMTLCTWSDDYGFDTDDTYEFAEVEKREVLVEKWVEV